MHTKLAFQRDTKGSNDKKKEKKYGFGPSTFGQY